MRLTGTNHTRTATMIEDLTEGQEVVVFVPLGTKEHGFAAEVHAGHAYIDTAHHHKPEWFGLPESAAAERFTAIVEEVDTSPMPLAHVTLKTRVLQPTAREYEYSQRGGTYPMTFTLTTLTFVEAEVITRGPSGL